MLLDELAFPDPRGATEHGLVAIGGDYRPERLLAAYARGIFPWPTGGLPYAWFSPDPRMVLRPAELHVPRRLRRLLRQERFQVSFDTAFEEVITACADAPRPGQGGTWITAELIAGFLELHRWGYAHSVEVWRGTDLVGGLYGIALGSMFTGESMFHRVRDASKVAFVHLVQRLAEWRFVMVDCQIHTPHLARFGAREWARDRFLDEVALALREPTRRGSWSRLADAAPALPSQARAGSSR